ncbi:MAG: hypothetical protein LBP92_11580, partial [Deltaproteobacteria bacterium]|nr:hypothetical protein [Deltaproteobacteria bacterium]
LLAVALACWPQAVRGQEGQAVPPPAVEEEGGDVPEEGIEKPITTGSMAHLYELMSREPPLSRQEVLFYEENLAAIVALGENPGGLAGILEATGWNQRRFTYVVTKIGVGLSGLVYPENRRLVNAPEFLRPTPAEVELIVERLEALVRGFQKLSRPETEAGGGKKRG